MGFSALDIDESLQDDIFYILSGILHLGNIEFDGADRATIKNASCTYNNISYFFLSYMIIVLPLISEMLGIPAELLQKTLTSRMIEVRGQKIEVNFNREQAVDSRDAI